MRPNVSNNSDYGTERIADGCPLPSRAACKRLTYRQAERDQTYAGSPDAFAMASEALSQTARVTIDGVQTRCTLIVLDRYHQDAGEIWGSFPCE
jgi:hypothetical protein